MLRKTLIRSQAAIELKDMSDKLFEMFVFSWLQHSAFTSWTEHTKYDSETILTMQWGDITVNDLWVFKNDITLNITFVRKTINPLFYLIVWWQEAKRIFFFSSHINVKSKQAYLHELEGPDGCPICVGFWLRTPATDMWLVGGLDGGVFAEAVLWDVGSVDTARFILGVGAKIAIIENTCLVPTWR